MKTALMFLALIHPIFLKAQVLLIPHREVSVESYLQKCKTEGYRCIQDFFKDQLQREESVPFEKFLAEIDLTNEDYRKNLFGHLRTLLRDENLNLDQAELIIKIIAKAETIEKNKSLIEIKNELLEITNDLRNLPLETSDAESFLIFKVFISKKQYANLKYKSRYTRILRITPYIFPQNVNEKISADLVTGDCENVQLASQLAPSTTTHYMAFFNDDCTKNLAFQREKELANAAFKWADYKKPALYVAIGLAAVLLAQPYNLIIQY